MTTPEEKLERLIPSGLNANSTRQEIITVTYNNNVGNYILKFIQDLKKNILRRKNGNNMCPPKVTWAVDNPINLTCMDNLTLFGSLGNSIFYKIANTYASNIQIQKKYLEMKSQGKSYPKPLTP